MLPYSINLIWSDEDKGFIATIPEFKNLSAFGETREEALREAEIVLQGYLETLKEEKEKLPEPDKLSVYSGQTRIRMPRQLHRNLAITADREGVSLNTYMIHLLSMNHAIRQSRQQQVITFHGVLPVGTKEETNCSWKNRIIGHSFAISKSQYEQQEQEITF